MHVPARRLGLRAAVLGALALVVGAACGSEAVDPSATAPLAGVATPAIVGPTAAPTSAAAAPSQLPTSTPLPAAVPAAVPTPTAPPAPDVGCVRIDDFEARAAGTAWRIVDDVVMGGRSAGATTFADGAMQYGGVISTNGGGFSSVRRAVPEGAFTGATEARMRIRSDGRTYEIIVDDATGDGRVSYFGALPAASTDGWQEVTVAFADLEPRVFGTSVEAPAFRPDDATTFGLILADGVDGPFALEVDWVDACG